MQIKTSITKKQAPTQDVIAHLFENITSGVLTTNHAASHYGQPIILEEGAILNYSDIESLTVQWDASDNEFQSAKTLESFGIRVNRAMKPLEMED